MTRLGKAEPKFSIIFDPLQRKLIKAEVQRSKLYNTMSGYIKYLINEDLSLKRMKRTWCPGCSSNYNPQNEMDCPLCKTPLIDPIGEQPK